MAPQSPELHCSPTLSQSSQSPKTSARVPLPVLQKLVLPPEDPLQLLARAAKQRLKTEKEKAKGESLKDPAIGVQAVKRCTRCADTHNRCLVARDPLKFGSFKCGHCISSKQKCSFSVENPGVPYCDARLDACRKRELKKRAAYSKCRYTTAQNRNKRLVANNNNNKKGKKRADKVVAA
ncbi:hypothetical protein F4824DRAFT_512854 [Ustulina deusta]|nr:hypothetical protein F4824DRAFT_512854 [Ustulina deusta]